VQHIADLLVRFHHSGGQGRAWVGISGYPPPRAAFLVALVLRLAPRDSGSRMGRVGGCHSLQSGQVREYGLAWGRFRIGTDAFWPATPHLVASNHAFDSELQRHITAGRGLAGAVSGPQIPQISMANHCIDLV